MRKSGIKNWNWFYWARGRSVPRGIWQYPRKNLEPESKCAPRPIFVSKRTICILNPFSECGSCLLFGSPISNFRFRKILEFPAIFLRKEMRCIPKITLSSHLAAPRIRLRAQKAKNFSEIWVRVHFPDFEMRPTSSCHFKFCFHFYPASGSCLDSRLSKISNYKVFFRLVTIKWRYRLHKFIPKLGLSGEENHIIVSFIAIIGFYAF